MIRTWHEALIDLYETRFLRRHDDALDALDSQLMLIGMRVGTMFPLGPTRHQADLPSTIRPSQRLALGFANSAKIADMTAFGRSKHGFVAGLVG